MKNKISLKFKKTICLLIVLVMSTNIFTTGVKAVGVEYLPICIERTQFDSSTVAGEGGNTLLWSKGVATTSEGALRLVPGRSNKIGAVVRRNKVTLKGGFSTYFVINLHDGYTIPGDGLVFVLQNNPTPVLGKSGAGLGFDSVPNSVGVEFDIYKNIGYNSTNGKNCYDTNENHVAIVQNGDNSHNVANNDAIDSTPGVNLYGGTDINVWIDYDGTTLTTYYGTSTTRNDNRYISKNIGNYLKDKDIYVGFSASTGGAYATQDIKKWYFKDIYVDGGLSSIGDTYAQGANSANIAISGGSGATNPLNANITIKDNGNMNVTNENVDIYIDNVKKTTINTGATGTSGIYTFDYGSLTPGNHIIKAVSASGGTSSSDNFKYAVSNYIAFAVANTLSPTVGVTDRITLTVKKSDGTTDTSFTGSKDVTISGVLQALDGSYGSFAETLLTGGTQIVSLNFINGVAIPNIVLNLAATHTIGFSIEGVTTPATNNLVITPLSLAAVPTVTSGSYTVSEGGTANETITNVPFGTTKAVFQAALTKGQANQTWDVAALTDPVVSGDKIIVTAEDGTTKVTYTVTVNAAPKSTVATVTSGSYTVSAAGTATETITNVPFGTTKIAFQIALTKGEVNQTCDLSALADPVVSGNTIIVTAEDGTTQVTYTVTVNVAPKSTIATVTSGSYTVSAAGTSTETITNVPFGTTKAAFKTALTKGEAHQTWDVLALSEPVVSGDKIVVTAEDGTTKVTYTVTVNAAPKSTVATVTSGSYTVSAAGTATETITNVLFGTTKTALQTALTKGEVNQTWDVSALADPIVSGDKIVVTAEDGTTKVTYTVTVNAAPKSTVATVTSGSYTVSAAGTATETITNVPFGTTKIAFQTALTKGEAHQTWDATGLSDTIVSGNEIVVTAEDGTTQVTYTITVNAAPQITYTLTYIAGANGTTTGSAIQVVNSGASGTPVIAIANVGYHFVNWSDNSTNATRTDSNVSGNINVTANFAADTVIPTPTTYALTYIVGTNGTLTGTAIQVVNSGASGTPVTAVPNAGYHFVSWSDGGTTATRTDSNVIATSSVTATFAQNSSSGGGGSFSGGGGTSTPAPTTIKGDVVDNKTGQSVKSVEAKVTVETDGTKTVTVKSAEAVVVKQADGTKSNALTDYSKLGFSTSTDTVKSVSVTITLDGTIQIKGLANNTESKFAVTYDLGNGQKIVIGSMDVKVTNNGEISLTSNLIDPYGTITDESTGKDIDGVNVTLYYANTERNKVAGKTPNTVVALPAIDGFKPNNNKNPQISDASGAYGFMVFPTSDYYLVGTKDGYDKYTSPTISVEQEIVKWDFKMINTSTVTKRIFGKSRVDTALEIAKATYSNKVSNIILATSENYPDALAGSVLAYKLNAPIFLVGTSVEEQEKVLTYIKDNMASAGKVYILGGSGAVSKDMEAKIAGSGFNNIIRLAGEDRYETAVKIAQTIGIKENTPIVIASGENYADALSISSVAAVNQYPIFIVSKDEISDLVKKEISIIKPSKVFIIGSKGAVSTAVEAQVSQIAAIDKANIVRIGGTDRFSTSLEVAKYFDLTGTITCVATGNDFPDALAGSLYAAKNYAHIILVGKALTDSEITYLQNEKISGATIFGGEGVVSKIIEQQLNQILGK